MTLYEFALLFIALVYSVKFGWHWRGVVENKKRLARLK
jgi:hypothetical protein